MIGVFVHEESMPEESLNHFTYRDLAKLHMFRLMVIQ